MCLHHVVELGLKTQHETKTGTVAFAVGGNDWGQKGGQISRRTCLLEATNEVLVYGIFVS